MSVYHQDVKKRVSKERTTRPPRVHTPSTIAGRAIHAPDSGGLSHASASPELFRATGQGVRGLGVRVSLALLGDLLLELAEGARDRRERAELALGRAHLG